MEDDLEVPSRQGRRGLGDLRSRTDELDLGVVGKRVAEVREPVAVARDVDAGVVAADGPLVGLLLQAGVNDVDGWPLFCSSITCLLSGSGGSA